MTNTTNEGMITVSNLVCVTFKANNYVTPYHFVGKTEEEAREKLNDFLNKKPAKEDVEPADKDNTIQAGIGRGLANTGKVWLLNRKDKARARVEPSKVDAYLAQGWELGGPKTKI